MSHHRLDFSITKHSYSADIGESCFELHVAIQAQLNLDSSLSLSPHTKGGFFFFYFLNKLIAKGGLFYFLNKLLLLMCYALHLNKTTN